MPELLTKHPDTAREVLKEQGAYCGVGIRPKILKGCPQEKFCALKGGEVCVFGPTELGLMTELTHADVCGPVPGPKPPIEAPVGGAAVGIGLASVAIAGLVTAVRRARRRRIT